MDGVKISSCASFDICHSRTISYGRAWVITLETRPPKGSNDRIDFFHKGIGKKDSGHI